MPQRRKLERAIVLAAGTGSRLVSGEPLPKPLKGVSGVPLLVRVLRTLEDAGIREAVIVVGHLGAELRRALVAEPTIGLSLSFVTNDRFEQKNGVSLLAARDYVTEDTLLTMADHLYSAEIVRRLRALDLPPGDCALAVDYDADRCFDLDDATKVRTDRGRIADIGKELGSYDALDTGVFRIGPELVAELDKLYEQRGDCSLSDGVRALAARGSFHACDIGDARWIDVDTPEALARAEAMVRVFGDALGDEPAVAAGRIDPEAIELFAPTWVRATQPYKEDHFEVAAGKRGVLRMMANESPFGPSARVLEAIMAAAKDGNLYPSAATELRRKIGRRDGLDEHHVMLGSGSTELIDVVIRTFVAPGEEALISVPTFSMYEARTRAVGGVPVLVPIPALTGEEAPPPSSRRTTKAATARPASSPPPAFAFADAGVDVPGIISAVNERTKVIFLCTPNNPTGGRIDESALRRVLRLGLPTVLDQAYYELGESPETLAHLIAEFPNAILLRTFSKAFGLAGMRIGYSLAHPTVIRLLSRVKIPWNLSTLTLAAASAVLDDVAEQESRLAELREGRAYLASELLRIPGVRVFPSDGNFMLVDVAGRGVSAEAVSSAMLERGVFLRTLSVHHASGSLVRITVGSTEQNARCVAILRQVLDEAAVRRDHAPAAVAVRAR